MDLTWQMIVNSLPHGLVVTDPRSVITVWNPTMEVLTGYPAAEALGHNSSFFQRECGIVFGPTEATMDPAIAIPRLEECHIERRDGGHVPVLKATQRLLNTEGCYQGSMLVFSDLRHIKALEGRLTRPE